MGTYRGLGLFVTALALTFAFQNCNKQSLGSESHAGVPALDQSSGGGVAGGKVPTPEAEVTSGGGNYDGKVYAVIDASVPCPDGSRIVAQMRGLGVGFQLERLDCRAINPPQLLAMSDVGLDAAGGFLMYKQKAFTLQAAPPELPVVAVACDLPSSDTSAPITAFIYKGTPLTGRVIAYADSKATVLSGDSGIVRLTANGNPVTDYGGRKDDGTVAFNLSTSTTNGLQKLYFVTGTGVSVTSGGTFNAEKFGMIRSVNTQCRAQ